MKPFLQVVAEKFYEKEGVGITDLCFVFPNRRSSLFFQKYLGLTIGKPIFSPRVMTINELFIELSGYRLVDKIEALYILYQEYVKLMCFEEGKQESFDEFVYWGDILLGDFDDIDKYFVPADKLFANVKDIQELNFGYDFLSENQLDAIKTFWSSFLDNKDVAVKEGNIDKRHSFSHIWSILYQLYINFKSELERRGLAYEGMIYRSIAEKLNDGMDEGMLTNLKSKYKQIVFVGQNAFTKCEKILCKALMKEDLADFYWDYYGQMITDKENKSSLFMKDNVVSFPSKYPLKKEDVEINSNPEFELISVPSAVGQTSVVSTIVENLASNKDFIPEQTAIVLPDEKLLTPILNSIPMSVTNVNVTMGMPLAGSNADTFMKLLESLQKNKRVLDGSVVFYYKNVVDIIDHIFFSKAIDSSLSKSIKTEIIGENLIYPSQSFLSEKGELFKLIFKSVDNSKDIPSYQIDIIEEIQKSADDIDKEYLYHYKCAISRLADLQIPMEPATYYRLISQIVSVITIPFKGEPLKGLQIMGPLETRALDFKTMIILSMNDGTFPKKTVSSSFIPYNLRRGFDLPTYEFQDSISAYHFYRSIYRCEKVVMLYDSRTEGLQSGEISRFIKQLKYHFEIPVSEKVVSYSTTDSQNAVMLKPICKDENVMKELYDRFVGEGKGKKTFSASSLNCYLNCPLQYYYKYVKGIDEEDEVKEDIDSGLFGTIFHRVMEKLYNDNYKSKTVKSEDIDNMIKNKNHIESLIIDSFREDANIKVITGKNLVVKALIMRYVTETLKRDKEIAPFVYIEGEKGLSIPIEINESGETVKLFGFIDRIDSKENNIRVVDYKTGSTDKKVKNDDVAALFDTSLNDRPTISLQLYLYALLMKYSGLGDGKTISPCVYSLKTIFKESPKSYQIEEENLKLFEDKVIELVKEVFDTNKSFEATPSEHSCKYCQFKSICNQ